MGHLGAMPFVEEQLEVISGQITAEQQLFVVVNEETIQKKKKRTIIESRISEVHMSTPSANSPVCGCSCRSRRRLSKRSL